MDKQLNTIPCLLDSSIGGAGYPKKMQDSWNPAGDNKYFTYICSVRLI